MPKNDDGEGGAGGSRGEGGFDGLKVVIDDFDGRTFAGAKSVRSGHEMFIVEMPE